MRSTRLLSLFGCVVGCGWASLAQATVLLAGTGQAYPDPCAAIAAAQANDEVDVSPGTYTSSCEINADGVIVKGVGGRPIFDLSGTNHPADYKGIFVVNGTGVRLENLELTGANIPVDSTYGGNGAGVRIQGSGLVIHGCYIHDNQDGVLGSQTGGDLTIEYSEFAKNGRGDGCNVSGCTHNLYINNGVDHFVFQFNWSHDIANDTPDKGHLVKSRAQRSDILYNRITGQAGLDSYEIDLPNGGLAIVVGNVIEKGASAGNPIMLNYGEEGLSDTDNRLFVVNNTFVNDKGSGTFINVASGVTLTAHNNLLVGTGTPSSTGALSADNLATMAPLFVDPTTYDYHIMDGSPAVGVAVAAGSADTFSLTPVFEYVEPTQAGIRVSAADVGAFEHGTPPSALDGGAILVDAGMVETMDAGVSTDAATTPGSDGSVATTDAGTTAPKKDSGCGCTVGGAGGSSSTLALAGLLGLIALAVRRRRAV